MGDPTGDVDDGGGGREREEGRGGGVVGVGEAELAEAVLPPDVGGSAFREGDGKSISAKNLGGNFSVGEGEGMRGGFCFRVTEAQLAGPVVAPGEEAMVVGEGNGVGFATGDGDDFGSFPVIRKGRGGEGDETRKGVPVSPGLRLGNCKVSGSVGVAIEPSPLGFPQQ
jgi:hypothetical protein